MILESTRSKNRLYVDWWLMNHCNYDCSYCADIIKNKSVDLPDIKNCLDFIDKIKEHCAIINKQAEFSITGGEVTQWAFLPDLLKKIRGSGFISTIRSNASPSVDDWQIIIENLDAVRLEFHPEYQNLSHFVMIVKSTITKGVSCSLTINMVPDLWEDLEKMIDRLESLYPDLPIHKKLLFSDPAVNSKPLTYSEPQIQKLENQSGDLIYYENQDPIRTDFQTLILHKKNKFFGNECNAGLEQFIIDAWGRVYRGHCRQGGKIGSVGKDIVFPVDPITCQKPWCSNGFDIVATKF
jgi:pyruvate-formate lyase-activating enzyme